MEIELLAVRYDAHRHNNAALKSAKKRHFVTVIVRVKHEPLPRRWETRRRSPTRLPVRELVIYVRAAICIACRCCPQCVTLLPVGKYTPQAPPSRNCTQSGHKRRWVQAIGAILQLAN